jgi:phosphoribosylformylglycinamidine synthase
VNAFCLGIARKDRIFLARAEGEGNPVFYVGAKTGKDGIHGATMASAEFDEAAEEKRPTVQVGDPVLEKLLLEACLELMRTDALVAIQDMGAAGLTCAASEMGARGRMGIEMDLDRVPQRERGMTAYEILLSESQERMLLVARSGREAEVERIFHKWDLDASAVGKVTTDGLVRVFHRGKRVAEVPARALADEGPVYERPMARPSYLDRIEDVRIDDLEEPQDIEGALGAMLESHSVASKHWVFEQYDHMVRSNTIVLPGGDAGVIRIKGTPMALAMCLDGNGRYTYLDPYLGGATAVAEGCRNLAAVGATPVGATNCLNFGNPEKPETMWQFGNVIDGMRDACQRFQVPVTGGNVSFYNETEGEGIFPTPVVGLVGIIEDRKLRVTHHFKEKGDLIYLAGETTEEIGGSEYLKVVHGRIDGKPPRLDFETEAALQELLLRASARELLRSAHDLSDRGLGVALAESLFGPLGETMGASIALETRRRADAVLFSEGQSRVLLSVSPDRADELERLADEISVPLSRLGVTGGDRLEVRVNGERAIARAVAALREAWWSSLERGLAS